MNKKNIRNPEKIVDLISIKKYIRQSLWGLIWIPVFTSHFFSSNNSSDEKSLFFENLKFAFLSNMI